ncbi:hypothetical protein ACI77E_30665, partial [Pseudomonas antarctica]
MKSQPDADATITVESYSVAATNRHGYQEAGPEIFGAWWRDGESGCKCPNGKPGDRLWVRETWARVGNDDPGYLTFGATYPSCLPPGLENIPPASQIRWKPSIHMFRR